MFSFLNYRHLLRRSDNKSVGGSDIPKPRGSSLDVISGIHRTLELPDTELKGGLLDALGLRASGKIDISDDAVQRDVQTIFDAMFKLYGDEDYWMSGGPGEMLKRSRMLPVITQLAKQTRSYPNFLLVQLETKMMNVEGSGAFGVIYTSVLRLAEKDSGKEREVIVAVKTLRDSTRKTVDQSGKWDTICEALAYCNLNHAHLLPMLGIYQGQYGLGIVLPWLPQGDIKRYLRQMEEAGCYDKISDKNRMEWLEQISLGVEHLHSHGIIHGDIKGNNILIDEREDKAVAIITDFGLTVYEGDWSKAFDSKRAGNPRWLAPEHILDDDRRPESSSDIYSFAMLCVEILTGSIPFHWLGPQRTREIKALISGGERLAQPENMSDVMFLHVSQWWHQSFSLRPPISAVVKFFRSPEVPPQIPKFKATLDDPSLLTWVTKVFSTSLTRRGPVTRRDVHILIDVSAFESWLKDWCQAFNAPEKASSFRYRNLQYILEGERTVASRTLISAGDVAINFVSMGYQYSLTPKLKIIDDIQSKCVNKSGGILVVLSGGQGSFLETPLAKESILRLYEKKWEIEIFSWSCTTRSWFNANDPRAIWKLLETFDLVLFP